MERVVHFTKPPVIEAVVDLDCDQVNGVNFQPKGQAELATQVEILKTAFGGVYEKVQVAYGIEGLIAVDEDAEVPTSSIKRNIRAFQLLRNSDKTIVQIRPTGFTFNRLAPYGSFDDHIPEIRKAWEYFCQLARPGEVRLVRLRYVNNIQLPLVQGRVDIDDYLKAGPRPPKIKGLSLSSFLNHLTAVEESSNNRVSVALTLASNEQMPPTKDILPVLFDNSAESSVNFEPDDWATIKQKLSDLRYLKNQVFKGMLTSKCRSLFQ
jgi:uncharacterized protein (TIGR04255 family)